MGRKIPGRKHHGVRDPEKQRQHRLNSIKTKINAPPENVEDQAIPKSLTRLIELKEKAKIPYEKKPKQPKYNDTGIFKQLPGEADRQYLQRVQRHTETVIKEAAFEKKYGVEIKRNKTGEIEGVQKSKKDELEQYARQVRKDQKLKGKKKKKKKEEPVEHLSKGQKRQLKLKEKRAAKTGDFKNFDKFKDEVKFGEITHAPPTLTAPRRVAPRDKPGCKNLLLKSIMEGKEIERPPPKTFMKTPKIANKTIDKKGKRRDLPHALRRQLDKQQSEIIEAYKNLKKRKHLNNER